MLQLSAPPPDLAPPVLPWATWYARERATFRQGQHIFIGGPTQSGKTTLARHVARQRTYTVVAGTKPNEDPSLVDYEIEGYLRIDHWPPTKKDWRQMPTEEGRFLVWPEIAHYDDLRSDRNRKLFADLLEDCFFDGRWCIVIDEGLWMASPKGLDAGDQMSALAYGSASNKVSMILLSQRPANIPPITWTSVSQALLFKMGKTDDVRELASLGTTDPDVTVKAVRYLGEYQFLDLPVRAQAEWAISQVDPGWLA